jgi:NADPH:quinone reductase-like Zn-dependent oxidoreductase
MFGIASFAPGRTRSVFAAAKGLLQMPKFSPVALMNDNRGVFGVNLGHLWNETAMLDRAFAELLARCDDGTYAPVVDKTFALADVGKAHEALQSRGTFGKILLVP